ncbi:hypothetical protein IW150_001016 [Coemansia sp. RSA 2607]|nr:hypothetical protein IW150_001892 [Coemansia sp. RSA 2607]KAJ2378067.1 hypothetical protein IW150_001016 [Coemansia sp. RSA 2607]KAJ2394006.1 hypothetical protein GGI05_002235 [Coemansia sp. RSA 2603]
MKTLSLGTAIFALASIASALSDQEKNALTKFNSRYHPEDHNVATLITELSEYSVNAGLSSTKAKFDQKQYSAAGKDLVAHIASIKSDPLVQKGKQYSMPYMMLNDCVNELRSKV